MGAIKTDNAFLADKVALRVEQLPAGDVDVLDCFAGHGLVWRGVQRLCPNRRIRTLPIDVRNDVAGFHLSGENQDFLVTLDLSRFNAIDLDAYGVPYEQLRILFDRGYRGVVFVTFILSWKGRMPIGFLGELGFPRDMVARTPTIYSMRAWSLFRQWLAQNGVTRIHHRSASKWKHYLAFELG